MKVKELREFLKTLPDCMIVGSNDSDGTITNAHVFIDEDETTSEEFLIIVGGGFGGGGMKYVLQRERNGYIEYLDYIYSEEYQFKAKVTIDIREVTPMGRSLADTTLEILAHTGEYFELKEVAE